ncbi:MAG: hypothetical protein EXX96DRAFT_539950 [Benjaminiella poitrasii]|nr:MAG: hypothetical protein EXX96DRAFT_539950 [Benjaminiella poitrasii]
MNIFGSHSRSSAKVMLHLVKLPSMKSKTAIFEAQFLYRSLYLPDNTLPTTLLPYLQNSSSHSHCSSLLSSCHPNIGTDPILWLSMTKSEKSCVLCWRLGWLPGGQPQPCLYHPNAQLFPLTCDPLPPHAPMPFLCQLH